MRRTSNLLRNSSYERRRLSGATAARRFSPRCGAVVVIALSSFPSVCTLVPCNFPSGFLYCALGFVCSAPNMFAVHISSYRGSIYQQRAALSGVRPPRMCRKRPNNISTESSSDPIAAATTGKKRQDHNNKISSMASSVGGSNVTFPFRHILVRRNLGSGALWLYFGPRRHDFWFLLFRFIVHGVALLLTA
jgi:hypothetical protein